MDQHVPCTESILAFDVGGAKRQRFSRKARRSARRNGRITTKTWESISPQPMSLAGWSTTSRETPSADGARKGPGTHLLSTSSGPRTPGSHPAMGSRNGSQRPDWAFAPRPTSRSGDPAQHSTERHKIGSREKNSTKKSNGRDSGYIPRVFWRPRKRISMHRNVEGVSNPVPTGEANASICRSSDFRSFPFRSGLGGLWIPSKPAMLWLAAGHLLPADGGGTAGVPS